MADQRNSLTRGEILREHKKLIYLAPITYVLSGALDLLRMHLEAEPWQVALLLLALGVAIAVGWMHLQGGPKFFLSTRFLALVLGYILIFSIAANSDLLSWKSRIAGFEGGVRRNFLALNPLGDWHYWFARAETAPGDLLVVTMRPVNPTMARQYSAELIQAAQKHGAIAVALDFDLTDPRPQVDGRFCRAVEAARDRDRRDPLSVFYGRGIGTSGGSTTLKLAESLPCLAQQEGGHLLGIRDWDRRIRAIPFVYDKNRHWQALSWKVATALDPTLPMPKIDFIIQFLEPEGGVDIRRYEDVEGNPTLLADKVVLAGFREADLHWTPFGQHPGVVIHAYAAQALRSGQLVRPASWWLSFPVIFVTCYLLLVLFLRGAPWRRITLVAAGLSVAIMAIAAAAMRWGALWIDVSYPLFAIWLFLVLLGGGRLLRHRQPTGKRDDPEWPAGGPF